MALNGSNVTPAAWGDRRSGRIERHGDFLLDKIEEVPDVTLSELRELLRQARGLSVATSTLWRFFERHGVTFKKRQRMPSSKIART